MNTLSGLLSLLGRGSPDGRSTTLKPSARRVGSKGEEEEGGHVKAASGSSQQGARQARLEGGSTLQQDNGLNTTVQGAVIVDRTRAVHVQVVGQARGEDGPIDTLAKEPSR